MQTIAIVLSLIVSFALIDVRFAVADASDTEVHPPLTVPNHNTADITNKHLTNTTAIKKPTPGQKHRQQEQQLQQSSIPTTTRTLTIPLFKLHNSYHANIYIGSPPQRRFVIVDTGSRYLVFPCKPCKECGSQHFSKEYFDPNLSSTDISNRCKPPHANPNECTFQSGMLCDVEKDRCNFLQTYAEGSKIAGFEMEDIVWFGTDNEEESLKVHMQHAVPISFGCQTVETGMIAKQFADGIFGLIEHEGNAMLGSMYQAGVVPNHAFSICLNQTGGILSLGGTALKEHHLEPMQVQPKMKSKYFSVDVDAILLGGKEFVSKEAIKEEFFSGGKGAVIDSGTTDSFLPKKFSSDFERAWLDITGTKYTNEVKTYTHETFQKLPAFTVVLKSGYKWVIEPHAYMEETRPKKSNEPLIVTKDERSWPKNGARFINRLYWDEPNGAVFGSNAMLGHDILFDLEHDMIGFAKTNC